MDGQTGHATAGVGPADSAVTFAEISPQDVELRYA
jgi:hypothetical protein